MNPFLFLVALAPLAIALGGSELIHQGKKRDAREYRQGQIEQSEVEISRSRAEAARAQTDAVKAQTEIAQLKAQLERARSEKAQRDLAMQSSDSKEKGVLPSEQTGSSSSKTVVGAESGQ